VGCGAVYRGTVYNPQRVALSDTARMLCRMNQRPNNCGVLTAFALLCACSASDAPPASVFERASEAEIRAEVHALADDFIAFRPMRGFLHDMPISTAYRWQDELVAHMESSLGPVVGYKTGGHDPGPGFPIFPIGGIRGAILEGMLLPDGTAIRLAESRRGFLEADIAVRVGSSAINNARTDMEILAALDAIVPFAEIPDPYYEEGTRTINGTIAANMGSRFSFAGEPVSLAATPEWLERLNTFTFAVHDENGNEVERGQIEGWYRPLDVVRWLRDNLREGGKRLEPGMLLSLGNIGIIRQLHEGSPRGPAYTGSEFTLSYYGLGNVPATVTILIDRSE